MCGRFAFTSPVEAVAGFFGADAAGCAEVPANTNICPTQNIVTIVDYKHQRRLVMMRWGFVPHWFKTIDDGPLLINARAETIAEKPAFQAAYASRRCIIPLNWYYEWSVKTPEKTKKKYRIRQSDTELLGCAAIWQAWKNSDGHRFITCAMLTKPANKAIKAVHHRMPVILAKADISGWLSGCESGADFANECQSDSLYDIQIAAN